MRNLTPHQIDIVTLSGRIVSIPPEKESARLTEGRLPQESIEFDGEVIPVNKTVYGDVYGLPPEGDEPLIVSLLLKQALPDRKDLYSPGQLVRDEKGNVVGCLGLSR
ncbi:MAG TPA: hypothetical protein PKD55_01365 [Bellilinea sp.]|nr:hypothetical protein [Bellilinea sp.]